MGRHFDRLVDVVNKEWEFPKKTHPGFAKQFEQTRPEWEKIIRKCALFEMPLLAQKIRPKIGKDKEEYDKYIDSFLIDAREEGLQVLTPFPTTGVEDLVSLIIFDNISKDNFECYYFGIVPTVNNTNIDINLEMAEDKLTYALERGMPVHAKAVKAKLSILDPRDRSLFNPQGENSKTSTESQVYYIDCRIQHVVEFNEDNRGIVEGKNLTKEKYDAMKYLIGPNSFSCIEQLSYIMDPENFIVKKESNASQQLTTRKLNTNPNKTKLRKTIMRPHYILLTDDDTKDFLQNEAKEPRPAHPVRGHYRSLRSPIYKNKQGQRIFIQQYFTGNGSVIGRNGWQYEVMIKESATKLIPYSNKTEITTQ